MKITIGFPESDALKDSIASLANTQKTGKFKPALVFRDPNYDGSPQ
jgi:hypothetical protein